MVTFSLPDEHRPFVLASPKHGEALSDLTTDDVMGQYRAHGAILFRGFGPDLKDFGSFARRFCPLAVHNDSTNRVVLDPETTVQSVNLGNRPFPLHPELSREPWKPDTAFFFCLKPPIRSGQTTLCDGVEIVRQLPADLRAAMSERRIKYVIPCTPAMLKFWLGTAWPGEEQMADPPAGCPFTFERHNGAIMRCFTRPLLHRPRFQDELAFGNFLLFARYLRGVTTFPLLDDMTSVPGEWVEAVKAVSDSLTVPIGWQTGDLVMVDNSRFLHGRTEVLPDDDRMIATYFGYLEDAAPDPEEPDDPPWRKPGFAPPTMDGPRPSPQ